MADDTGLSKSAVQAAVKNLIRRKLIRSELEFQNGRADLYRVETVAGNLSADARLC